jgi:hypothetical protein
VPRDRPRSAHEIANHAAARDVIYLPTQRKGLTGAAHIRNDRLDILAANLLGRALYPRMSAGQERANAGPGPGRCAELHHSTAVTSGATRDGMTIESYPWTLAARQ